MLSDQSVLLLITAFGSIAGLVVQLYRESRNRRWQLEDRRLSTAARSALHEKMEETTARIELSASNVTDDLTHRVAEIGSVLIDHPRLTHIEEEVREMNKRVPTTSIRSSDVAVITGQRRDQGPDRRHEDSHVVIERRRRQHDADQQHEG